MEPLHTALCPVLLHEQKKYGEQKNVVPNKLIFLLDKKFCPRLKSHDQFFCMIKNVVRILKIFIFSYEKSFTLSFQEQQLTSKNIVPVHVSN